MRELGALWQEPLVETLALALIHFVWQGAVLGVLLYLTLQLLVRHSAQVRYAIASFSLLILLAFPFATTGWFLITQRPSPTLTPPQLSTSDRVEQWRENGPLASTLMVEERVPPIVQEFALGSQIHPLRSVSSPAPSRKLLSVRQALPFIVIGWFFGVLVLSLRLLGGWLVVRQLTRRANRLAPAPLQRKLAELSRQLSVRKRVRLLESHLVKVPIVTGWVHPVILLPSRVVRGLSLDKLTTILAHELIHIRRHDWFIIIGQKTAETLFFYHPVVWWLSAQIEREREHSCDDLVIATCGDATLYAYALAELEALRVKEPQLALAASSGSLLNRIRRLIMASSAKTYTQSPARAVVGALVMAMLLPVIIGFSSRFAFAQTSYNEAPMLTERVTAGELPPVAERLPANPVVVPVVERIGNYGGTWRTALLGGADSVWLSRTIGYENLVRWDPEWATIIPNVAESFEVNDEATVFTFHLREGLKWSDGHPFTADDILFWYEGVAMNPELSPSGPPSWLVINGEPVVVDKVNDYTVTFTFAAPHGLFMQHLASGAGSAGGIITSYPHHYLAQFHAAHNPDAVDGLVQEAGLSHWVDLFENRANLWQNTELPRLHGWVLTTPYDGSAIRVRAERNPYYWKVDPEGNQLPYLDQVTFDIFEDVEVLLLRALSGEIDMYDRHLGTMGNRAVLFDNMERGNYRFYDVIHSSMNTMMLSLNLTHKDPVKQEIFNNKDFRTGISHAINRPEIIDLLYLGMGEPWQGAPFPNVPFFHERLATQYTEYDPALASEHFDQAGYTERDGEGFRVGPDGRRISFTVEVMTAHNDLIAALEVIQGDLRDLGIDMQVRAIDRSLFLTRKNANEHDATVWQGDGGMFDALLDPRWYFPFSDESHYAIAWAYWYQGNPQGEEPSDAAKQQMELYEQIKSTADPDRQVELMYEILDIAADQFYAIGLSRGPNRYGIVKNDFRNVPESMPGSGSPFLNPAATNPVQYFLEQP